jgi:hypothetical protein
MSYTSSTIASTVDAINRTYFLPAIQRPYVWEPSQIVALFDSVLKGYPISTFLFWEVQSDRRADWDIYKFVENFRRGDIHNELLEPDGRDVVLVLDGQQRLTSLLIGLRGSYTVRRKYSRKNNPDSFQRLRLYLDLLASPEAADADAEELGITYGLKFFEGEPKNDESHLWIKLGRILDCTSDDRFDAIADEVESSLPPTASRSERRRVHRTLERLYRVIWKDEIISFYTEKDQSYDRVLDIFIRANDGGTKLSKSDLLLSMVTSKWRGVSAREEIFEFVDYLNSGLAASNSFDKDFIMKASLVVCDLDHVYKVKNFTNANLSTIESQWSNIRRSLEATVRLVNAFGIDKQTLLSANALMPIAYYLHRTGKILDGSSAFEAVNAGRIHRFLLGALLNGSFSGTSDTAIGAARVAVREGLKENDDFPADRLAAALERSGRITSFDERNFEALFETEYGDRTAFLALSLLYDTHDWGRTSHHVDHIIPRSSVKRADLLGRGLSSARVEQIFASVDRLGNLELLLGRENLEKNAKPFDEWIRTRDPVFLQRHAIPIDRSLWRAEALPEFVAAREQLMQARMRALHFSRSKLDPTDGGDGREAPASAPSILPSLDAR